MQIKCSAFFIIISTFIYSSTAFGMLPEECQGANGQSLVPSLQELCLQQVSQIITTWDVNTLKDYKLGIAHLSQLSPDLGKKLVKHVFFAKQVYVPEQNYNLWFFDEENNRVTLVARSSNKISRNAVMIHNLNDNTAKKFFFDDNDSFFCNRSNDGKTIVLWGHSNGEIKMIRNLGEREYSYSCSEKCAYHFSTMNKLYHDTNEFIVGYTFNGGSGCQGLFNLTTGVIKYPQSCCIIPDNYNNFYIVQSALIAILYKKVNEKDHEQVCILGGDINSYHSTFSPNGKQLLVSHYDQKTCRLMSLFEDMTINLDAYMTDDYRVTNAQFSETGEYMILSNNSSDIEKFKFTLHDTKTGFCYGAFQFPIPVAEMICESKQLIVKNTEGNVSVFSIEEFLHHKRDNNCIMTYEQLVQNGIATPFEKQQILHPSKKYTLYKDGDNKLLLTQISSKKVVATFNNVSKHEFSSTGKMLFLRYIDGTSEVLFLRNDFTAAEYVLYRLMKEKNLEESDVRDYPDLQAIYETMKAENKHEFSIIS